MSDDRSCVYVDAPVNSDVIRTYYEVSEATAQRLRQYAGDDYGTLTFDQVCEAVCDELRRVLECYGALRDWSEALGRVSVSESPGVKEALDRVFDRAVDMERRQRGDAAS